jgi:hypothetical protein
MQRIQIISAIFALLCASAELAQAGLIDTRPSWNGSSSISQFGYPDSSTFGQTVTASSQDHTLNSFAFEVKLPSAMSFRGEVYAWDGTKATGPALFESGVTHTTSNTFQLITFNTGGLDLQNGHQYVLFASTARDFASNSSVDTGVWASSGLDSYSGGQFVFLNNLGNSSAWTSEAWTTDYIGAGDLAFTADFAAESVPEPTSMALLGSGVIAAACGAYRRRKQAKL